MRNDTNMRQNQGLAGAQTTPTLFELDALCRNSLTKDLLQIAVLALHQQQHLNTFLGHQEFMYHLWQVTSSGAI